MRRHAATRNVGRVSNPSPKRGDEDVGAGHSDRAPWLQAGETHPDPSKEGSNRAPSGSPPMRGANEAWCHHPFPFWEGSGVGCRTRCATRSPPASTELRRPAGAGGDRAGGSSRRPSGSWPSAAACNRMRTLTPIPRISAVEETCAKCPLTLSLSDLFEVPGSCTTMHDEVAGTRCSRLMEVVGL